MGPLNNHATPDCLAAKAHITAAREQLHALEKRAALDGLPRAVMQRVLGALNELGEAHRLLASPDAPAEPAGFVCPYCGLSVAPTAALCAFCWRELTPVSQVL
jgi:hypothetical protein